MYGQDNVREVKLSAEEEEAFRDFWGESNRFPNRFLRCRAAIHEGFNAGAKYVDKRYGAEITHCQTQARNANIRADLAVADANAMREANRGLGIANSRLTQELDVLRTRLQEVEAENEALLKENDELREESQGLMEDYQDLGAQISSEGFGGNVTINVTVVQQVGTTNEVSL